MTAQFSGVPSSDVGAVWPYVERLIEEALGRSVRRYHASHVREFLEKGGWQLWIAYRGNEVLLACCTEILTYPCLKSCNFTLATGHDRQEWLEYLPIIEAWAAAQGCTLMEGAMRPGWRRVLKDYRWTHCLLERELCPPQSPPTS